MINNDVLRRLRYALNMAEPQVLELFRLAGREMGASELDGYFKKEGEPGYVECGDEVMELFLEGLVTSRRGKREGGEPGLSRGGARLTNNDILKRLRIALELRDDDIAAAMALAGARASKTELAALFRRPGQRNYRPCGDQFLRNFLAGLTAMRRA